MAHKSLLVLFLIICLVPLSKQATQNICLYSGVARTVLRPLQLKNTDCPSNTNNCMSYIYKYGNFQYNGISTLKPQLGEVVAFLAQSENGAIDYVAMLNAKSTITSKVTVNITGAAQVPILLQDDPNNGGPNTDHWTWNPDNTGNFTWTTQPGFTDGVVIGHITFIDNYCISSTYTQAVGAITTTTVLSGSTSNVSRVLSGPYTPGSTFEFCQYPTTSTVYTNATCPGSSDGSATISVVFGPANLQFTWTNSAGAVVSTTATATGLPAGTYHIAVNDTTTNGCDADRFVTISDHALNGAKISTTPFACTTKGSATATADGGADDFTFSWFKVGEPTPFATGTSVSNLDIGSYYVQVIDSCGSVANTNFTIGTIGCCGDGTCQSGELCSCDADCGKCCPAGTFIDGTGCTVCPPGSFSSAPQSTSCTSCPANTYNDGGNDTCLPCPPNYASAAGSGVCSRCPSGQSSSSGSSCAPCPAGKYAPCDDSPCTACPVGTYAATTGTAFCATCAPGTYSSTVGSVSCLVCPVGTYSSAGESSCTPCPSSQTTSSTGAAHILACN